MVDLTRKATLFFIDDAIPDAYDEATDAIDGWLEKWKGQYKIVKDHGSHNEIVLEMDVSCTEEAFKDIPEDYTCSTEWARGEMTEDEVLYGQGPRSKQREKQIRNLKKEGNA